MTLDQLAELAKDATPGPYVDAEFIVAIRNHAAALIAVARAAEKVAADRRLCLGMTADECDLCDALAKLDALK